MDRGAAASPGAAPLPRPGRGHRVAGTCDHARARLDVGPEGGRAHRCRVPPYPDRRATHSLGLVLSARDALLQLAARARATRGAGLRGRARAVPSASPESLARVLGARRATSTALAPAARLAASARPRAPGIPSAGLIRQTRTRHQAHRTSEGAAGSGRQRRALLSSRRCGGVRGLPGSAGARPRRSSSASSSRPCAAAALPAASSPPRLKRAPGCRGPEWNLGRQVVLAWPVSRAPERKVVGMGERAAPNRTPP